MSLVLYVTLIAALLLAARLALGAAAERPLVKICFAPGPLAAVLVRVLASLLAGASVEAASPLWSRSPPVRRGEPKVPVLGPFLLGVLPFAALLALILLAHDAAGAPAQVHLHLPSLEPALASASEVMAITADLVADARQEIPRLPFAEPRLWFFLWIAVSLGLYLAPDAREVWPLAALAGALAAFLAGMDWLGLEAGFLSRGWFIRVFYGYPVWDAVALLLGVALASLVAGSGITLGLRLLDRLAGPRERE